MAARSISTSAASRPPRYSCWPLANAAKVGEPESAQSHSEVGQSNGAARFGDVEASAQHQSQLGISPVLLPLLLLLRAAPGRGGRVREMCKSPVRAKARAQETKKRDREADRRTDGQTDWPREQKLRLSCSLVAGPLCLRLVVSTRFVLALALLQSEPELSRAAIDPEPTTGSQPDALIHLVRLEEIH